MPDVPPLISDLEWFQLICEGLGMRPDLPDDEVPKGKSFRSLTEEAGGQLDVSTSTLNGCLSRLQKMWGEGLFSTDESGKHQLNARSRELYLDVVQLLEMHRKLRVPGRPSSRRRSITLGGYSALLESHVPAAIRDFFTGARSGSGDPVIGIRFKAFTFSGLLDAIERRLVAFGVASVPERETGTPARELTMIPLGYKVERGVIVPPGHKLASQRTVKLKDLASETVFRLPSEGAVSSPSDWLRNVARAGGEVVEVTHFNEALECVKLGLGVATVPYLPGQIADAVAGEKVVYRSPPELNVAQVALYLPRGGEAALSSDARVYYDVLSDYFLKNANSSPLRPCLGK